MIKYVQYNSHDEYGQHIFPITDLRQLNKTASSGYSPELLKAIANIQKKPSLYYVVINAMGSYEVWGDNGNGDAFPEAGLIHKSLRTDMGTKEDYGYKTFEYYAHFFKHHVNKPDSPRYGEIIFSHWNPKLHRVELIVGIDHEKSPEIITALDKGEPVSVSMGCLTNGNYPISTINGYKPIKDIVVGDVVWTHAGRWKKVTELHRRVYTGNLYEFSIQGLPIPLELTADHMMMAKTFFKDSKNKDRTYVNPEEFESTPFDWVHSEHIEHGDHIQYLPTEYNKNDYCSIDSVELAKIMGYYVAEGSFCYNNDKPCTTQLNCHLDDDLPREVPQLINKIYPNTLCNIYPRPHSEKGLVVNIHSTQLSCFLFKYLGKLSHKKFIPPEIFVSNEEVKLSFFGAWLSGDGFADEKGLHVSSCNLNLLLQGRDLLISCGIPSSIYKITHKEGVGFNDTETIEFTLNISNKDLIKLTPYAGRKIKNIDQVMVETIKQGNKSIRTNQDGTFSYYIKEINVRYAENVQTYNFEVEDDESYNVAGLVSHNCKVPFDRCSICGNKAKTRDEYCKHAREYMGTIVDEVLARQWSIELGRIILPGTKVFVFNDFPRFFDLSRVYIGADRTSFILTKAASKVITLSVDVADAFGVTDAMVDKIAQVSKTGEIDKEVGANGVSDIEGTTYSTGKSTVIRKALREKLNRLIEQEPEIPAETLNSIATALPLKNILSTMVGMGIHPKPREFQRIVLVSIGHCNEADNLDKKNIIFNRDEEVTPAPIDISTDNFSDTLGKILLPFLASRSSYLIDTRQPEDPGFGKVIEISKTASLPNIASLYAGLKMKANGYTINQIGEVTSKPWLEALLGGGIMYAIIQALRGKDSTLAHIPASNYEGLLDNTDFSGHIKNAGVNTQRRIGNVLLGSALAIPAMYGAVAYDQRSIQTKGRPVFGQRLTQPGVAIPAGAIGTAGILEGIYQIGKKIK